MKASTKPRDTTLMEHQAIAESDIIDGLSIWYIKTFRLWKVINDYRTTGKRNFFLKAEIVILLSMFLPYIFCQCMSAFYIEVDVQKAALLYLHATTASQIFCKMLVLWFRIEKQCKLFNLVRKDFLELPAHKRPEVEKIYRKISSKANKICTAYVFMMASIVVVPIVYPDQSVDYILHHTGKMDDVKTGRKKVLGGWYPVPMADSPYFEFVYTYEATVHTIGGTFLISHGCLFFQVLMCLYAQFAVFGYHISTMKAEPMQDGEKKKLENENYSPNLYRELDGILKHHKKLLDYTVILQGVYNPLTTLILGTGQFLWIISVFQFLFGSSGNAMSTLQSLQFVFYQGIEVCMFCFGSSFIEKASADLHFAIYSSEWYRADIRYRKAIQMVMMRCKKGVTLTAIRMYPVNVETLMSMLQFTYSVATLLSRMLE